MSGANSIKATVSFDFNDLHQTVFINRTFEMYIQDLLIFILNFVGILIFAGIIGYKKYIEFKNSKLNNQKKQDQDQKNKIYINSQIMKLNEIPNIYTWKAGQLINSKKKQHKTIPQKSGSKKEKVACLHCDYSFKTEMYE